MGIQGISEEIMKTLGDTIGGHQGLHRVTRVLEKWHRSLGDAMLNTHASTSVAMRGPICLITFHGVSMGFRTF